MSKDEDRHKRYNEDIEDIDIEIRKIDNNNRNDMRNKRFNKGIVKKKVKQ